jgi:hypothetical protein
MTHKERYNKAHKNYMEIKCPTVCADGHYSLPKMPDVKKSNGLTMFIINYLNWSGHHGERTNTMGRPIQKYAPKMNIFSGKIEQVESGIEWQKGTGIKGSSDIKGVINVPYQKFGVPCFIEIKVAKDKQSAAQIEYEKKINKTGGLYVIVKTPDDFLKFFDDVVENRI